MNNKEQKTSDPKGTLAECRGAIGELRNSIRELLSNVAVVSLQPDKTKKLNAWNTIDQVKDRVQKVHDLMNRAVRVLLESPYGKGADTSFQSSLKMEIKEYEHLKGKYEFLMLQSQIEHSEQTISQLRPTLPGLRLDLGIEERNWTVNAQEITLCKKQIQMQENRLLYELRNIFRMINAVINHEHFSDLPTERRQTYHAKWRTYNDQFVLPR